MQKTQLNDMNFENSTTDLATVQLEILAPIKEVAIFPTSHSALTSPSCNMSLLINSETSGFKLGACVYMALLTWRALKRSLALSGLRVGKVTATTRSMSPKEVSEVIFHLRDINQAMTNAWEKEFAPYSNTVKVY